MGWFGWGGQATQSAAARARQSAWEDALARDRLPPAVAERLAAAASGRAPWVATMTPAELLVIRSHGCRPVAAVSGTCWYGFGRSWTEGHAAGWATAQDRIQQEAIAAGANAIVDVKLRTIRHRFGQSMDFTLLGTAIKVEGLKPSPSPVIATVSALEFVQLLEMDIVPTGIAVGARFEWLYGLGGTMGMDLSVKLNSWRSLPVPVLTPFWESIRRDAHADLRRHAATMGNGVLAHTHFGQLFRQERDKQPPAYLGRHIVIGTVVDTPRNQPVPHHIEPVVDMLDELSPLKESAARPHHAYPVEGEGEGPI